MVTNTDKEIGEDFTKRRIDYLVETITKSLKTLGQKELEDIHFLIEKRNRFVGFDSMGREIYSYPQPIQNSQFDNQLIFGPPNPMNMRP